MSQPIPACRVCGRTEDIISYPDDPSQAICPTCCAAAHHPDGEDGHQFDYERSERQHICRYCGLPRSATDDYFDD